MSAPAARLGRRAPLAPNAVKRPAWPCIGRLLAMVALISQVAIGAMPHAGQASLAEIAAVDAVGILCSGAPPPPHQGDAHHTHRPAPAICPIGVSLGLAIAVLTPAPLPPTPAAAVLWRVARARPPGRGPPPPATRVGAPRAPPLTA
jgi:hypothetical protein